MSVKPKLRCSALRGRGSANCDTKILADKSYRGDLGRDIEVVYGVVMELLERVSSGPFEVEPLRWVVERTWAWLDHARSLTRDYERLPENHVGMVYVVMLVD